MKFQLLIKTKLPTNKEGHCFKSLSCCIYIMLINVKMPTIVSWISFMLSWVEYEKSFITSGPSPVWTLIEDICAYIYDDKAYKNLVCWPKL